MKQIITQIILLFSIITYAQDISGKWNGIIESGKKEPVVFNFNFEKTGQNYATTIDIPAMRVANLKPKETIFSNEEVIVNGANLGFKYQGKFNKDLQQIEGTFTEGINSLPLILKKTPTPTETQNKFRRPQEPLKPYPYKEEEITFRNGDADITLSGTLTLPFKSGKYPVVILISGSGPQDRDETFYKHKPFLVLSDYLTSHGIGVLRYDDRGVGKSTGDHSSATTRDLASDVLSAIEYLKSRKDCSQIGLIGHSEGAIIAPMVTNLNKNVSFIVMLGGTGIPGSEVALYLAKKTRGFSVQDESKYEEAIRNAIKIAASDEDLGEIKRDLKVHYYESIVPMLKLLINSDIKIEEIITSLIETRTSPWNRYFYNYNPAKELEKVTCPILALNGSKDTQVQSKINQEGMRKALTKGHNKDFSIYEIPNVNHLFQECESGEMDEYSTIQHTIAPSVLKQVSDWILDHSK